MTHSPNPTAMSREAEAQAIGYLNVYRDGNGDLETGCSDPYATVEEALEFNGLEFGAEHVGVFALVPAATLRSHPATAGGKPGEGELREAFERWIKHYGFPIDRHLSIYKNTHTAMCWNAWQASRKSTALARPVAEKPAAPVEGEDGLRGALELIRNFARSSVLVRNDALDCVHAVASRALAAAPKANGVGTGGEGGWEAHSGEDYTVVMRPDETTDSASIQVFGDDRETLGLRIAAALNFASTPSQGNDEGAGR